MTKICNCKISESKHAIIFITIYILKHIYINIRNVKSFFAEDASILYFLQNHESLLSKSMLAEIYVLNAFTRCFSIFHRSMDK